MIGDQACLLKCEGLQIWEQHQFIVIALAQERRFLRQLKVICAELQTSAA
jgi:hypothetical protein